MKLTTALYVLSTFLLFNNIRTQLDRCDSYTDLFNLENYELISEINLSLLIQKDWPGKNDFIHKPLGSGSFGHVFSVTLKDKETGESFDLALKATRFNNSLEKSLMNNEVIVYRRFSKKYPLSVCIFLKCAVHYLSKEKGTLFMLTEKLDFDLYNKQFYKATEEDTYQKLIGQFLLMTRSLNNLHSMDIVHNDIKSENFMYKNSQPPLIKMIDFGMTTLPKAKFSGGSPSFKSPEIVFKQVALKESDNYSLGITFFDMLFTIKTIALKDLKILNTVKTATLFFNSREITMRTVLKQAVDAEKAIEDNEFNIAIIEAFHEILPGLINLNTKKRMGLIDVINTLEKVLHKYQADSPYLIQNEQILINSFLTDNKLDPERYKTVMVHQEQILPEDILIMNTMIPQKNQKEKSKTIKKEMKTDTKEKSCFFNFGCCTPSSPVVIKNNARKKKTLGESRSIKITTQSSIIKRDKII